MDHASRTCAVAAVLLLAGIAAGCGEHSSPTRPTDSLSLASSRVSTPALGAAEPDLDTDTTVAVTPQLAAVRAATAKFHDISAAYAAGYTTQFEPCVENPGVGAMGIHARNDALMGNQLLEPLQPELLLYAQRPNGGLRLTGVEYFEAVWLRNRDTNEVERWFSTNPWPSNYEVVTPTPQLFGHTFDGPMPGHNPTMPWHWDLHVWIWAHNPSGMFAEWNPRIQCE